jgi:hypothetical protein
MTTQLKIGQSNVHTTQGKVMVPLLAYLRIFEFSVLDVQEPWQNPRILTTHNSSSSFFYCFFPPPAEALV